MKLLLQILWGWSVLANGAVGIQVGTVQTNNQNIKLMKMNFTSPVWLQSASNVGGVGTIEMLFSRANPSIIVSSRGKLTIEYITNGEPTSVEYQDPSTQLISIPSDENTIVLLKGDVTSLRTRGYSGGVGLTQISIVDAKNLESLDMSSSDITEIDLTGCVNLEVLNVSKCSSLAGLDLSTNSKLTDLDCSDTSFSELDLTGCVNLETLTADRCSSLIELDLSENTQLTTLSRTYGSFEVLNVSANTKLKSLNCLRGQLKTLDVSKNTELTTLSCDFNNTIETVFAVAVNSDVANSLKLLILASSSSGTVTLRNGDEYNSIISDAATTKSWTVEYTD